MALFNRKSKIRRVVSRSNRDPITRKRRRNRMLFRLAVVFVVAATLFFLIFRSGGRIGEYTIGTIWSPVQNAVTRLTQSVKNTVTQWRNYDALQSSYTALSQENERLSLELSNAEEAVQENERLKDLLDARSAYESLDPIYARVIARDAGQWFTTFSINRGEMNGVTVGMAVVNGSGLIGRVYKVGLNYASVLTVIDGRSGVACLVQRTRDNCIVRGGVENDSDASECFVHYLPNANNVMPGDVLVTSGTDSVYPKGITVGTITEVSLSAGSEGTTAVITPAVDFQHIEEVLILRDVVERASDSALPAMPTATPGPTALPTTTPDPEAAATISPSATDDYWSMPNADATVAPQTGPFLRSLPEDDWADEG